MALTNTHDGIKSKLISKILSTNNEKLLQAISTIFDATTFDEKIINVSKSQIEILKMAEKELEYGNLISQEELDKIDSEWMQ